MATLGACGVAWSAVDRVAAQVTGRPPIVGEQSIRRALGRTGAGTTGSDSGIVAANGSASGGVTGPVVIDPVTGKRRPAGAGGASEGAATGARRVAPAAVGWEIGLDRVRVLGWLGWIRIRRHPAGDRSAATTATTPAAAHQHDDDPPQSTATVFVTGGSVVASCSTGTPTLVSAIPNNGYGTTVRPGHQLLVTFTSATHRSVVETECEGTRVHFSTSEERDDSPRLTTGARVAGPSRRSPRPPPRPARRGRDRRSSPRPPPAR